MGGKEGDAHLVLLITLLKKILLVHGTEKLCSKFGEDRSIITSQSCPQMPDTGHVSDFIVCPMLYIALDRQ